MTELFEGNNTLKVSNVRLLTDRENLTRKAILILNKYEKKRLRLNNCKMLDFLIVLINMIRMFLVEFELIIFNLNKHLMLREGAKSNI